MEMNVYKCINLVQAEIASQGISKDKTAQTGGSGSYKFRGIDDIYNSLSVIMAKHGLCVLPKYSDKQVLERQSAKGNALFYTTIRGEFDFVSSHDGSKHTISTIGEAMDSGDKGANKAMSAAYKYACLQTFCIPTEGQSHNNEDDFYEVKPDVIKKIEDCKTLPELNKLYKEMKPSGDIIKLFAERKTDILGGLNGNS